MQNPTYAEIMEAEIELAEMPGEVEAEEMEWCNEVDYLYPAL